MMEHSDGLLGRSAPDDVERSLQLDEHENAEERTSGLFRGGGCLRLGFVAPGHGVLEFPDLDLGGFAAMGTAEPFAERLGGNGIAPGGKLHGAFFRVVDLAGERIGRDLVSPVAHSGACQAEVPR
jgi:hypothetical protein